MYAGRPDLSLMGWGGTTVKLFPEMETWQKEVAGSTLYARDWEGNWELVGPTAELQGGGPGLAAQAAIANEASAVVGSGPLHGLAGSSDPTLDLPAGVENVYLDEIPGDPSNSFPGSGVRSLVNVCTTGTEIPARVDSGGGVFVQGSQACPAAAPGRSHALISPGGATLGNDRDNVISDDGERVFFMSPNPGTAQSTCSSSGPATQCPAQLYVRQRTDSGFVTRWISRSEIAGQAASLMGPVRFEGASTDGDKVFFRTASPLTDDDRNGEGQAPPPGGIVTGTPNQSSWDLYMYDMPDAPGADPTTGDLVRISTGPNGDGDCNSPFAGDGEIGALRFASDDGSRLYFTCAAPLSGVPLADDGTITSPGGTPSTSDQSNLYAYDATKPLAQRWRFVARLPRLSALGACATTGVRSGLPLGPKNDADPDLSVFDRVNCVHGIEDGSLVTFWTDGRLTDDDPDDTSGDLYAYDYTQDELTRVSEPQGGAGGSYTCSPGTSSVQCYGDGGVGLSAGESPLTKLGVATDPDSGERLVYFESRSQLIAADTDDAYDVYQWKSGELSLISTGQSPTDGAFFAGNSRDGRNVYFATRDRLTWQDEDSVLDVYSARVDGGIPQPPDTSETCDPVSDQCQGPGTGTLGGGQTDSDAPTAGNPAAPQRIQLTLPTLSRKALGKAARTARLRVRVRASGPATIAVVAKSRIAGRTRTIATARKRAAKAGAVTVTLRLSKVARNKLRRHKPVRVTVVARAQGSRSATSTLTLRRR
jgi:hypothetical protein